jgi:glycosyltransferase involved in cell wall biosynthesis
VRGSIAGGDRYGLEVLRAWEQSGVAAVEISASAFSNEINEMFGYCLPAVSFEAASHDVGAWRLEYVGRFLRQLKSVLRMPPAPWGYSFTPFYYDALPMVVLRLMGRVRFLLVPVFHTIPPPSERGWRAQNVAAWLENRIMLRILRAVGAQIIVDNVQLIDELVGLGFPRESVILSSMGVPRRHVVEGREEQVNAEHFDCIYVGRLASTKGVDLLLQAWSLVVKRITGARLALVGSRDANLDLESRMADLALTERDVQVFEGLSDAGVQSLLRRSKCFVTASFEEGYCLAVAEAMREGLPCVTFDLPAFKLVYPCGRLVVSERSASEFASAIVKMLGNETLRRELAAEVVAHYHFKKWSEVADDLWRKCTELCGDDSKDRS